VGGDELPIGQNSVISEKTREVDTGRAHWRPLEGKGTHRGRKRTISKSINWFCQGGRIKDRRKWGGRWTEIAQDFSHPEFRRKLEMRNGNIVLGKKKSKKSFTGIGIQR